MNIKSNLIIILTGIFLLVISLLSISCSPKKEYIEQKWEETKIEEFLPMASFFSDDTYNELLKVSKSGSLNSLKNNLTGISEIMDNYKAEISEVDTLNIKIKGLYDVQAAICDTFIKVSDEFGKKEDFNTIYELYAVNQKFSEFLNLKDQYETEEGAGEIFSNLTFNAETKNNYSTAISDTIENAGLLFILEFNLENSEDMEYISAILERFENDRRLDGFLEILENKLNTNPGSIAILYTLSDIYKRKNMVEQEYNIILRLEEAANNTLNDSDAFGFIYDRKDIIEKNYDTDVFLSVGSINITTAPEGASVYLEGDYKGVTPLSVKNIKAGDYKVRVELKGYYNDSANISINPGENKILDFDLNVLEFTGMVFVKGNTYLMGSENGDVNERPIHTVQLSDYYIGKYEVTNEEAVEVFNYGIEKGDLFADSSTVKISSGNQQELLDMNSGTIQIEFSRGKLSVKSGKDNYPCVNITWYGAVVYCNLLSEMNGLDKSYNLSNWSCNFDASGYRLPTEAEWEYAARGGRYKDDYEYSGSNSLSQVAWNSNNSGNSIHPVGELKANSLGIFDMSGNVCEWNWDWYDEYTESSVSNPEGPKSGENRIVRGGAFYDTTYCRVSDRNSFDPGNSHFYFGFRIAKSGSR